MNSVRSNLDLIQRKINESAKKHQRNPKEINLVVVSKNFGAEKIVEAIEGGARIFGENKVTEAKEKWPILLVKYPDIKLHLIGHLQSNKAREAVKLFDVIQSLDSEKLAVILADETKKQNKFPEIFVQINIGEEEQKSGIAPDEADKFIAEMMSKYQLNITGVMAIPPAHEPPALYFGLLTTIARRNNLANISMGMSADYELAIGLGANFVRVGSAIFGERN
jgi:pyridoxal phosphate enzyme (YggS family)